MAGPQKLDIYQFALRHLGDARLALITDDVESRYALDDAWPRAVAFVLRQAAWRFALKTQMLSAGGPVISGYQTSYLFPADWLRTHAAYRAVAGRECPFDFREQGSPPALSVIGTTAPTLRYVSNSYLDPAFADWPEHFAQLVAAYLAFLVAERVTGERSAPGRMSQLFSSLLPEVAAIEALPEDRWLRYQRDGSFLRASQTVMPRGFWYWAIKTLDLDSSMQLTAAAQTGFPYAYAFPADFVQSHALYVAWDGLECPINIRETSFWSTDAPAWTARYLSTAAFDATQWPEAVSAAVLAYLDWQSEPEGKESAQEEQIDGAVFERLFAEARRLHALPESDWLRFQLDGSYQQAVKLVLEKARWRFAIKTVTLTDPNNANNNTGTPIAGDPNAFSDGSVSPGYSCRMLKPNDWLRTIWVYFSRADGIYAQWCDIDFRDEEGAFHVNYTPIKVRYLSRLGLDATQWPANFRDAVLSWLQYEEARADPKQAAVADRKMAFFAKQLSEAETLDDERDVPRVRSSGRFVQGRLGRGSFSRENALPRF